MLIKTQGIILRSVNYGETSLILDIYTENRGRVSCIIGSVRSAKAKTKQSVLSIGALVDMVIYYKPKQQLCRIKEVKPAFVYQSIPFQVIKGTVALFMTELISKTVKEEEENSILFDFIINSFIALDESPKATLFPVVFSILLLPYLGFQPGNEWSENCPFFDIRESVFVSKEPHSLYWNKDISQLFQYLLKIDIANLENIQLAPTDRRQLLDGTLKYYQYHIDNFQGLNSHLILREVLG